MKATRLFGSLVVLLLAVAAAAQTGQAPASPPQPPTMSQVLNNGLRGVEGEFVSAAEAMPEDKFNYAPTNGEFKGVRTFAQQVRHVAAVNYMVAAAIAGEKVPVDIGTGESGPDNLTSKADIIKFLRDSFAYGHRTLNGVTPENATQFIKSPFGSGQTTRLGMGVLLVGHCFDHYGQMVEYLRSNGIVPPASRPR